MSDTPAHDPWEAPNTPSAGAPPSDGTGIPWENEQTLTALLETMKRSLLDPQGLFKGAKPNQGMGSALVYAVILGVVGGGLGMLWQLAMGVGGASLPDSLPKDLDFLRGLFTGPDPTSLIMVPVGVLLGAFVWAGIIHVMLLMFGAGAGGFEATFRAVAYAQGSVALFQLVPFLGGFVAGIWSLVIEITAVKELHATTGGKAAAAVLLPILVCTCVATGAVIAAVAAFSGGKF